MRILALAGASCLAAGCSSTMAEPRLLISPYLAVQQLRGDISLQSSPSPGVVQDNPSESMRTFGQDHYREDIGVRADFGDGFGGVRIEYMQLEQNTADSGVLSAPFGSLLAGDTVRMNADMDELKVGYVEPVVNLKTTWRDEPLSLRVAIGALIAYRDLDLRASTTDGARRQNIEIEGDVVYPTARFRIGWREVAIEGDYAISPNLVLDGDYKGTMHDIELRATYRLPMRDVTFFGGWRYSVLPAEGHADNLAYDADLIVDGFQLGVTVTF